MRVKLLWGIMFVVFLFSQSYLDDFICRTNDSTVVFLRSTVDTVRGVIFYVAYRGDSAHLDSVGVDFPNLPGYLDTILIPHDNFQDFLDVGRYKWSVTNFYFNNTQDKFVVGGGLHPDKIFVIRKARKKG